MRRFYTSGKIKLGQSTQLDTDESKHAIKVLRLDIDDNVLLCDGTGFEYQGKIQSIQNGLVSVLCEKVSRSLDPNAKKIHLIVGVLKGPRMDWLVEKATEIGALTLQPVETQFSQNQAKEERWSRLAQSALKQSGNLQPTTILPTKTLSDAITSLPAESARLVLDPYGKEGLAQAIKNNSQAKDIYLAFGPEGGFSPDEQKMLLSHGFEPAKLTSTILRGETAAIAALAIAIHAIDF